MAIEDALILPEFENALRINTSMHPALYSAFKDEVQSNTFMTREIRANIIARWMKILPKIERSSFKVYLSDMERKYWASIPAWETKALTNKITNQSLALQEEVKEADQQTAGLLIKKARVIDQLNQTVAKVNRLIDQAPTATFVIQTNGINDDEMAMELNAVDAEFSDVGDDRDE
jgi:hypothetical protein